MDFRYQYKAKIIDVYDGDTITALVDLGFLVSREMKFRLYGIDTPELRGVEREEGIKVRDILRERILDKEVVIYSFKDKQGKYGRYLASVLLDGEDINQWLVGNGYAKPYFP
ncbi:thermonuclease family protein [Winogradskyella sp.]|jgi:micrococcal nuclease|uniref:thermonuclease family protein n=1 Tax=Winogradskyella sp. TaxID=1883156 RepID=UPI0025D4336B|nr:thermonuclease family protein [Winogradskyella sp.]MCT4628440.1 thermonuclease family protein [Winogradskyella sp.]